MGTIRLTGRDKYDDRLDSVAATPFTRRGNVAFRARRVGLEVDKAANALGTRNDACATNNHLFMNAKLVFYTQFQQNKPCK